MKDNTALLSTIRLSQEASQISYHTPDLTAIRIRSLDVLVGMIRDFPRADELISHLEKDIQKGTSMSNEDEILYYANMALYSAIKSPDYDKALAYGKKALGLTEGNAEVIDERLRIISNLIQHSCLAGLMDESPKYIAMGEVIFDQAQSDAYKALFVLAKNVYLLDKRDLQGTIDLVQKNEDLLDRQKFYPSMKYFILNQLAEAYLKNSQIEEAKNILGAGEKCARDYHGENEQNMFFGKFYVMKGMCLINEPDSYEEAKGHLERGIKILDARFGAPNKHKLQAFAYLQLVPRLINSVLL